MTGLKACNTICSTTHGGLTVLGSDDVIIEGASALRRGDVHFCPKCGASARPVGCSSSVLVNGRGLTRHMDEVACAVAVEPPAGGVIPVGNGGGTGSTGSWLNLLTSFGFDAASAIGEGLAFTGTAAWATGGLAVALWSTYENLSALQDAWDVGKRGLSVKGRSDAYLTYVLKEKLGNHCGGRLELPAAYDNRISGDEPGIKKSSRSGYCYNYLTEKRWTSDQVQPNDAGHYYEHSDDQEKDISLSMKRLADRKLLDNGRPNYERIMNHLNGIADNELATAKDRYDLVQLQEDMAVATRVQHVRDLLAQDDTCGWNSAREKARLENIVLYNSQFYTGPILDHSAWSVATSAMGYRRVAGGGTPYRSDREEVRSKLDELRQKREEEKKLLAGVIPREDRRGYPRDDVSIKRDVSKAKKHWNEAKDNVRELTRKMRARIALLDAMFQLTMVGLFTDGRRAPAIPDCHLTSVVSSVFVGE